MSTKQKSGTNVSSNWKLAIILISIFLSELGVIIGWVIYGVKKDEINESDRKICRIFLIIMTILWAVAIALIIALFVFLGIQINSLASLG
jgi:hypothetical protein